jgi:hypothetical protein
MSTKTEERADVFLALMSKCSRSAGTPTLYDVALAVSRAAGDVTTEEVERGLRAWISEGANLSNALRRRLVHFIFLHAGDTPEVEELRQLLEPKNGRPFARTSSEACHDLFSCLDRSTAMTLEIPPSFLRDSCTAFIGVYILLRLGLRKQTSSSLLFDESGVLQNLADDGKFTLRLNLAYESELGDFLRALLTLATRRGLYGVPVPIEEAVVQLEARLENRISIYLGRGVSSTPTMLLETLSSGSELELTAWSVFGDGQLRVQKLTDALRDRWLDERSLDKAISRETALSLLSERT